MTNKVIITGANGFIGSHLKQKLVREGFDVFSAVRLPKEPKDIKYELEGGLDSQLFEGSFAVIHCAYSPDGSNGNDSFTLNIDATKKLKMACDQFGVRFIFLSTISAHEKALSDYGRHKYYIEKNVLSKNDLILKLGMVIGIGGMFERLYRTIETGRVIPLVDGGRQPIYTIDVIDVCDFICAALQKGIVGEFVLCDQPQMTMRDFYQAIKNHSKSNSLFFSIPYYAIYPLIYVLEKLKVKIPISRENLKGLAGLREWEASNLSSILSKNVWHLNESLVYHFSSKP